MSLSALMAPGVRILGLNALLGRDAAHYATYSQISTPAGAALDFTYAGAAPPTGGNAVSILPYLTNRISETDATGAREVVSGPFTGCVMTIFRRDGLSHVGHVDTNPATSQRTAYASWKSNSRYQIVNELDTTGLLSANKGEGCIVCIADGDTIVAAVMKVSIYNYHATVTFIGGEKGRGMKSETMYEVLRVESH